jgi:protein-S-isoprenylcysteine O-methyltransferase Ste14
MRAGQGRGDRVPVLANATAFALFYPILLTLPGPLVGYAALLLALAGCLLAIAGAAVLLRARVELGPAWSFVPIAHEATGLVTTGPYRLVRHPIYLGLAMLALGQALAFVSWPAFLVLLAGIIPTFVWRAAAEEKVLTATFGERYALYQTQTKLIIPHLL